MTDTTRHDEARTVWAGRLLAALAIFHLSVAVLQAQSYTLRGEVEPVVHAGQNFKLRYVLNSTDASNFTLGTLPDAFDVLIGPTQSTSISTVIINGDVKTDKTLTLTYVLTADKTGKFTIPPASVKVGSQTVKSQPLTVQVIAGSGGGSGAPGGTSRAPSASSVSSNDFFVMAVASKKHVKEYEPFLLTYKVCWHPDLPVINLDPINLELQGVYMQPYNDTQQKSKKVETINGRVLVTVDWQQYVVYPQKPGHLQIPSMKLTGYIRQDLPFDPFDPFSAGYREVPRQLSTPAIDIQVDELTDKPADFSGGVGRFTIEAQMDQSQVKENTPVTIAVKVSGKGNLNMLKQPTLLFPRGFDTYDTKQTDNFQLTAEGLSGSVGYEYVAVPQRKGRFVIPPASLTYFDVDSRSFRTVTTDSFRLEVLKGDGSSNAMVDYSGETQQPGDIRPIKTGMTQTGGSHAFFASAPHLLAMLLLVVLFTVAFVVLRRRESSQADVAKAKGRRANKVAVKRLRRAARLMHDGKPGEFYDETLRALWGYVGDKLNIPVSQLSRENISQQLATRGVDEATTASFIQAIDECEFVRYAPGDPQGNMAKVYEKSVAAIEQIESVKHKAKGRLPMLLVPALLACQLALCPVAAQTKVQADELYSQEEYELAIDAYARLLQQHGPSAEVSYNMGNAYYRLDSIAQAILHYERALRLLPGDDDVRFNLQLARSKTTDKIIPEREMFFVTWYHAVVSSLSSDAWAVIGLVSLALALALLLFYFFAYSEGRRRIAFFAAVALLALFVVANWCAWQQKRHLARHDEAIVMVESVTVRNIPSDNADSEFTLHAGTKVTISDNTMADWTQIRLPDGCEGWVEPSAIEPI